ncbi:MAG: DUF3078 domain-containing protein [Bacteroidota bacterium]|nr:DUF3078 domain-containing protein [Bacteroidota bacterium]
MRKLIIAIIVSAAFITSFGQDNITVKKLQSEINRTVKNSAADTTPWNWVKGGTVALNGTQGSLRNWAAGGDKFSMAINTYVNYYVFYRNGRQNWDNNLDFNFGLLQSTSTGTRKNDDRLDLLSKYGYNFDGKWFLSGLFNFRTQLFDGYNYSSDNKTLSSTFLSPAYVLTSAGFDFKPSAKFSAFISPLTSRWVIVASSQLAAKGLYGVDSGHHVINEFGAFASINVIKPMSNNISYKGRLDLFSNYLNKPQNVDLFFTNYFAFKINKYLAATYNLDLIYDDNVRLFGKDGKSPALQLKSLIGLGFTLKLN